MAVARSRPASLGRERAPRPPDPRAGSAPAPLNSPTLQLLDWIELLADEVGPRRPTSDAERQAAELVRDGFREGGVDAELEPIQGFSTFAAPVGLIAAGALAP